MQGLECVWVQGLKCVCVCKGLRQYKYRCKGLSVCGCKGLSVCGYKGLRQYKYRCKDLSVGGCKGLSQYNCRCKGLSRA